MDPLDINNDYSIVLDDPTTAEFTVTLFPCSMSDDDEYDKPFCCRAKFRPLTWESANRLKHDIQDPTGWMMAEEYDVECRILGVVLDNLTCIIEGSEKTIRIQGMIPLIIRKCVTDALYNIYVRTVPKMVTMMTAVGIDVPRARSILDGCDSRSIGDDSSHRDGEVDG